MNTEKKLFKLLTWGLAVLMIVMIWPGENTKAEYILTMGLNEYYTDPHYVHTETRWEVGNAGAEAYPWGYASCSADTWAWAKAEDDAYAMAVGRGSVVYHWEWNGPPGSTPPGGDLYFSYMSDGDAEAEGGNLLPNYPYGAAISTSDAANYTYGNSAEDAYSWGWANGYVSDYNYGCGWKIDCQIPRNRFR